MTKGLTPEELASIRAESEAFLERLRRITHAPLLWPWGKD